MWVKQSFGYSVTLASVDGDDVDGDVFVESSVEVGVDASVEAAVDPSVEVVVDPSVGVGVASDEVDVESDGDIVAPDDVVSPELPAVVDVSAVSIAYNFRIVVIIVESSSKLSATDAFAKNVSLSGKWLSLIKYP